MNSKVMLIQIFAKHLTKGGIAGNWKNEVLSVYIYHTNPVLKETTQL